MGKTFDQSLIDTARIPMSMIDPEDMMDTTSEEFVGLRRVQQGCHSELTNREDFPFNKKVITLNTVPNEAFYEQIEGIVTGIYIDGAKLEYEPEEYKLSDTSKGKPYKYALTYNPDKMELYPTPDKVYEVVIKYNDTKNVLDVNGTPSYEITEGSTLRMPERVQHLYFDALEYRVLYENMRKQSNPRWQPTLELFNEKWQVFLKGCKPNETETYFVI